MPARQGHDGRSRVFEADGTLGLHVHLEGAVVLALGGVGGAIALVHQRVEGSQAVVEGVVDRHQAGDGGLRSGDTPRTPTGRSRGTALSRSSRHGRTQTLSTLTAITGAAVNALKIVIHIFI